MSRTAWLRIVRPIILGTVGTLGLIVILLLPDLFRFLPVWLRACRVDAVALFCLAGYAIARLPTAVETEASRSTELTRSGFNQLDNFTDWILRKGLVFALGMLCLGLLLAWVPHYLTWPWWRDADTFALLAQSWDQGVLPYRDIRAYNFPGATYLAWVLGKVFGWGHTVPLYAFDAACLVLLGVVLLAWSRRRLGGALPGLIGYLAVLAFYLNFQYDRVVERDWQTALLVCLAILFLQAWPGRSARLVSALMIALALSIRPHAVLFLPALVWEVAHGANASGVDGFKKMKSVAGWCLWFGIFAAMAFAPLALAGIAGDFVNGLRVAAYGGPYSKTTLADMLLVFLQQFTFWKTDIPLVATLLTAARPRDRLSGMARTWSWAWLGALFYQPVHPVQHFYLMFPVLLVSSITWAFAVCRLLSSQRLARPVPVLAIALLVYEIVPALPAMCSFTKSLRALRPLVLGEMPDEPPLGCPRLLPSGREPGGWDRYRQVLNYLRLETSPGTLVANVLNRYPYESLNGPTGRLSPFLAESGICWMRVVDVDLDAEFAKSLSDATDSVVVWTPRRTFTDQRLTLPCVHAVIRRHYAPAARFGEIEVWKRKVKPQVFVPNAEVIFRASVY